MPAANASRTSSRMRAAAELEKRARISVAVSVPASAPWRASTSRSLKFEPASSDWSLSSEAVMKIVVVSPRPTDPPATWNM